MTGRIPPRPLRTFVAAGGWIVVVGLLATAAAAAWSVSRWLSNPRRAVGDGRSVASYGFDLSPCLVPAGTLVASGMSKDGLRALTDPAALTPAQLAGLKGRRYRKLLLDTDLVAGLTVAGEDRAYPLRFLAWHEVVNDVLGGRPIAVTYHPITGTVAVFDRVVGGRLLELGVSGLLCNSGQVLYDRRADRASESLWSQLGMRAIAGPAAAARQLLAPLPLTVAPWSRWLEQHPGTTVLAPDERLLSDYRRAPYSSYFGSDLLRYPVAPLPPATGLPLKTEVVAVRLGGRFHAFTAPFIIGGLPEGAREVVAGGTNLRFRWAGRPARVWLEQPEPGSPVVYSLLFAWYATHGRATVWHGLDLRD